MTMLAYQGKESVCDIGADVSAEWGVVPEYFVLLSVFSFVSRGWFVVQSVPVSAFVGCFWYGGMVWALEDKHFPKDHSLRKIFNRKKIKISYSCMNGTKQIVDKDNKRILYSSKHINDTADNTNTKDTKTCNCRQKNTHCLKSSLIYQATVTRKDNSTNETYIGLTENDFKTRYRNHTASFRHTKHRNSTELSKHIWILKENNINHFISKRILSSRSPNNSANKRCNLCFVEKLLIIRRPELSSLNKRDELVSSCRNRNKALLRNN